MFNLGLPEMLVLGAAALLLFGPRRLPELAKSLGKGLRDFKKAVSGEFDEQNVTPTASTEPPRQITLAPALRKSTPAKKRTVAARGTKKPRRKKSA